MKIPIDIGGFEHSRESLKSMTSQGSFKSKIGNLIFPLMDGTVSYTAALNSRAYHYGDTVFLTLVLENKLANTINSISIQFNNYVSLIKSSKMIQQGLFSAFTNSSSIEENFTESEILTVITERITIKPQETIKKTFQIVVPHNAFPSTKFIKSICFSSYLDIIISVDSQTPSLSNKNFQVPIVCQKTIILILIFK